MIPPPLASIDSSTEGSELGASNSGQSGAAALSESSAAPAEPSGFTRCDDAEPRTLEEKRQSIMKRSLGNLTPYEEKMLRALQPDPELTEMRATLAQGRNNRNQAQDEVPD